jgi:hypothetical protein
MHNNDEAELRAQVRSEVKTDKLPELLRYLPNIANLAQDIDGLAHKIRGVPTALLNHALDGLAHDIKKLQASTRESLDALAEPSKVTAKNLERLAEELETAGNCTVPQNGSLPEMLEYLERLATILEHAYAQIGIHCIDTLSYMEWTPEARVFAGARAE